MRPAATSAPRGVAARVRRLVTWWALAGGGVLVAVVATTVASVAGGALFGRPFAGDVELVRMGTAIAAFAFLPYAQLTRADVSADIFTRRASARTVAIFGLVAALTALVVAALLFWRMSAGMLDYRRYQETTAILEIPHWVAFPPILVSLALLAAAAAVNLGAAARAVRRRARG
jgi:TRAP-type C4-dicarboxylate transport system permease small subunit